MKTTLHLIIAALMLCGTFGHAANITVTTTVDEVNGNTTSIANLIATPGGAGIGLREAIIAANNTAGADTILFAGGTNGTPFTLTRVGDDDTASLGDLDVLDSLTITGNGATSTIIQAGTNATNGIDKVLALNPTCAPALRFTLTGITVRFGRNTTAHDARFQDTGGGIDWCGAGTGANAPSLTISDCVITQNATLYNNAADSGHYGGGLNIDEVAPSNGVVTITNTVFSNNSCTAHGGGLNVFGDNVQVTISGSTFSGNTALGTNGVGAQGGGINIRITNQNDGDGAPTPFVNISNSTIVNNTGVGFGGGIDVQGSGNQDVNISNTAITGNSLIVVAGGVTNTSGGGLDHSNNAARTTTLTNVLIANNTSTGSATSLGGGVSHGSGVLVIRNSTISGNSTTSDGGGVYVTTDPTLTLINTTISNNRANSDNNASGTGGAIRKLAGAGTVTLQNTICDGNFRGTGATVDEVNGAITANFSLIADTTGATISGANNQTSVSARLAALAGNGGPTVGPAGFTAVLQTHALLAGSPALDNGSNALVPGALTTDQRGTGFARILDAADANTTDTVDIGALEQHPSIEDVANQAINEDGSLGFAFNVGDADLVFDSITATAGNTTLVPNNAANISVSGSGSSRTLTINPAPNQFGTTTITLTATDTIAGTALSMSDTFLLTVNPLADPPTVSSATTPEDTQSSSGLVIGRNAADGAEVTHFRITGITGGTLFKNNGTTVINNNDFITFTEGNAGLKFTPSANLNTPTGNTFGFTAQASLDAVGTGISTTTSTSITVSEVNDPPTAAPDTLTNVAEDSGQRTILAATLTGNDSRGPANENAQTLTITAAGSAVGGTVSVSGGNVLFDPTLNFNGAASFSYTITDNGTTNGSADPKTSSATASFMITPVNDPPVITGQNVVSTPEETARTIVFGDLLVSDPDNTYPTGFTLTVMDGTNYTRTGNAITPALDFNGTLTVPVKVNDGAADSNVFNLSVSVTALNDPPAITGQNLVSTPEETERTIVFGDLLVSDPDNTYPTGFTLTVMDGTNYTR
ncbi:MAG: Ig-like domain-containing protein, partial [Chthoniobacteraceae bacterium]